MQRSCAGAASDNRSPAELCREAFAAKYRPCGIARQSLCPTHPIWSALPRELRHPCSQRSAHSDRLPIRPFSWRHHGLSRPRRPLPIRHLHRPVDNPPPCERIAPPVREGQRYVHAMWQEAGGGTEVGKLVLEHSVRSKKGGAPLNHPPRPRALAHGRRRGRSPAAS